MHQPFERHSRTLTKRSLSLSEILCLLPLLPVLVSLRRRMRSSRESSGSDSEHGASAGAAAAGWGSRIQGIQGQAGGSGWGVGRGNPPGGPQATATTNPPPPPPSPPRASDVRGQRVQRGLPPLRNPRFLSRAVLLLSLVLCAWNGAGDPPPTHPLPNTRYYS